jgi:hypothetical protein
LLCVVGSFRNACPLRRTTQAEGPLTFGDLDRCDSFHGCGTQQQNGLIDIRSVSETMQLRGGVLQGRCGWVALNVQTDEGGVFCVLSHMLLLL